MGAGPAVGGASLGVSALQMVEAKNLADAQRRSAEFEAQQLEFNSQLVSMQKDGIGAQLEKDLESRQTQTKQMIGAQKVALAGQGIDIEGDLGEELQETEHFISNQDVQALKNNAWRQAMGLEIESADLRAQAGFTRLGGRDKARNTLVTGGLNATKTAIGGANRFRN